MSEENKEDEILENMNLIDLDTTKKKKKKKKTKTKPDAEAEGMSIKILNCFTLRSKL